MRVPHYRQHQLERRQIFVRRAGDYRGSGQSRLFVWRSFLTTAAALSRSGSSHAILCYSAPPGVAPYPPVFPVLFHLHSFARLRIRYRGFFIFDDEFTPHQGVSKHEIAQRLSSGRTNPIAARSPRLGEGVSESRRTC
jgi:hypothetical protein